MDSAVRTPNDRREMVSAYKAILRAVLDTRPSGTRNRLAEALGKNRSFISQITSPAYDTPIPAEHLDTIFELCHFSAIDRENFLKAYDDAHPSSRLEPPGAGRTRTLSLVVPDFGEEALNERVDRLLQSLASELGRTFGRDLNRK